MIIYKTNSELSSRFVEMKVKTSIQIILNLK